MSMFVRSALRSIKQSLPRFLSVLCITFLGAGMLAGLQAASPNMQDTGDAYFKENNVMDLQLVSNVGFETSDVDAIAKQEDVLGAMGGYTLDTLSKIDNQDVTLRVQSLPEYGAESKNNINTLTIIEGQLPKNSDEAVIVIPATKKNEHFPLNSEIIIDDATTGFKHHKVKVVGFATTAYYLSFSQGTTNIGSGKIDYVAYLPQDGFDMPVFTNVFVTLKDTQSLNSFQSEYASVRDKAQNHLEDFATNQESVQYNNMVEKIDVALKDVPEPMRTPLKEEQVNKLTKPAWSIYSREQNDGFALFRDNSFRIQQLASVFPIIFYLVAILVSLTTMTRMVDEDRLLIGTFKALGYSTRKIIYKYLSYASIASILGGLLGVLVGFQLLPTIIWNAYSIIFSLPTLSPQYFPDIALLAIGVSVACTCLSTLIALRQTLKEVPAQLLLPKAPKKGKRIFLEHITPLWSRLSFSIKVTIRNLFLNKSRMLMTIVGIAGCTALLLTGFGIRSAVNDMMSDQFTNVIKYNVTVNFSEDESLKIQDKMKDPALFSDYSLVNMQSLEASIPDKSIQSVTLISPKDDQSLPKLVALKDSKTNESLTFDSNSVIIDAKLALLYDLNVGDTFSLNTLNKTDKKELKVTGITKNYLFHYVYIGADAYKDAFDKVPSYTSYIAKHVDSVNEETIQSTFEKQSNIQTIQFSDSMMKSMNTSMGSINIIVVVLIVASALLAFVVLYNLTNINIGERQREIATLKVLGFYNGETYTYILRESLVLAMLGCVVGCLLGMPLYLMVVKTMEMDYWLFSRTIPLWAYLVSAVLTMLFSLVVCFLMTYKIKRIDMLESLKSIE